MANVGESCEADRAANPKPSLVLIPGLLCSDDLFGPQRLGLADYAQVSIARITGEATLEGMARSVLRAAPERFALAGLSLGGYVAFEVLRQAPERVTRLALLDTNARADRPEQIAQRQVLAGLARTLGVRATQAILLPFLLHPDRLGDIALRERVLKMADWVGPAAFARQQEAIIARPDNRPFLAGITCPTLIIVGAQDLMTPVKVAEELHSGIAGSRLEVIPDCGHLSTLERPEAVNAALRNWLTT
jgi:pimeloyl-ACP methyl ester carboxylesterase